MSLNKGEYTMVDTEKTDKIQVMAATDEIQEVSDENWEPKIIAFLCNWCSYAGADLAGVSRIQYPPNVRVVRVPCSGRINPLFILKSLQVGWDAVLISGCHPGDCHYISGNYYARRKFSVLNDLLDFIGIDKGRVNFSWVSAAEGEAFAKIIRKVTEKTRNLGPNRIFKENQ